MDTTPTETLTQLWAQGLVCFSEDSCCTDDCEHGNVILSVN